MMRPVNLFLIASLCWCAFWWGQASGLRAAMQSELSSARTDEALSKAIRSRCDASCPLDAVDSIGQLTTNRVKLVEAAIPRGFDLILAPVTGPISAWQLAGVREGAD
jgi:hypothetical protein